MQLNGITLIGLILNGLQPFKNAKIYKEMYGFPDKLTTCPEFYMRISCSWGHYLTQ